MFQLITRFLESLVRPTRAPARPRRVVVQGNIGAGKSVMINGMQELAAKESSVLFQQEDVARWSQEGLLDRLYGYSTPGIDPDDLLKRNSSNTYIFSCEGPLSDFKARALEILHSGVRYTGVVQERDVHSTLKVFNRAAVMKGYAGATLTEADHDLFTNRVTRDDAVSIVSILEWPDAVIFLDVSPKECHRRALQMRGRGEEVDLPLGMFESLDTLYREYLTDCEQQGCRVIKIDGMDSPENISVSAWQAVQDVLAV